MRRTLFFDTGESQWILKGAERIKLDRRGGGTNNKAKLLGISFIKEIGKTTFRKQKGISIEHAKKQEP